MAESEAVGEAARGFTFLTIGGREVPMIARLELQDLELRRQLTETLVPPGAAFWTRRVAVDEDLLTWKYTMSAVFLWIVEARPQPIWTPIVMRHWKRLGQVLHDQGATSGAELVDAPLPRPRKRGYGSWHHFRDL